MNREVAAQVFRQASIYLYDIYNLVPDEELDAYAYGSEDIWEMKRLSERILTHEGCLEAVLADMYYERLLQHAADVVRAFLDPHEQFKEFYAVLEARHIDRFPLLQLDINSLDVKDN